MGKILHMYTYLSQVLGFNAPSFTFGTDLMLPVGANAELRTELEASPLSEEELDGIASVPQVSWSSIV